MQNQDYNKDLGVFYFNLAKKDTEMKENLVYHYCDVDSFLNIIRNHTLRLSDLCISTDNMEMKALLEMVKNAVERRYRSEKNYDTSLIYGMGQSEALLFLLDRVIMKIKKESNQMLYGICFSEDEDLLGQWREYADKGRGLSIGFQIDWFKKLCDDNALFKFKKVKYINSDNVSSPVIEHLAKIIYVGIGEILENGNTKQILDDSNIDSSFIATAKKEMFIQSIFAKRKEFMEEKEWRLIINDENTNKFYDKWRESYNWKRKKGKNPSDTYNLMPNALEFMTRRNRIVSYLDLKYDTYLDELPIEKIIIGPNCKVTEGDIFHLLEFYGFEGNQIAIVKSKSSYNI